jgi:hypothetical protein
MVGMLALAFVVAGCGGSSTSTTDDGQPLGCDSLRRTLVEAKAASNAAQTAEGRAEVEAAAKAARTNGCNIDDLVGPNVGR